MQLLASCYRRALPLVILAFLAPKPALALLAPAELTLTDGSDGNGKPLYVLSLRGFIVDPVASNVKDILAKLKPKQKLLLRLHSQGGARQEGNQIIAFLKEEKNKGREIFTAVENGDTCGSMCVPVYMQGKRRYAGEGTLFMFHGVTQPDISNAPMFFPTEEYIDSLVEAGMSRKWIDARREDGVFSKPGAYWISGKELYDAQANAITNIVSRHVIEEPWSVPFDPNLRSR